MKLQTEDSILNFGDTSFRRKKYMVEYKQLLTILSTHMDEYKSWERDPISQRDYYSSVIYHTDIFDRNETDDAKLAKRARTLTNSMVKVGLITDKRILTEVGRAWLEESIIPPDKFEKTLSINTDNLVFFRQWSKFRLFDPSGIKFFSPFIFALKFLSINQNVPLEHFITILHTIKPSVDEEAIDKIINGYIKVTNNEIEFIEYFNRYVIDSELKQIEHLEEKINNLLTDSIDQNEFNLYFINRKSQNETGEIYKEFVTRIIEFNKNNSIDNLKKLEKISRNDKIKRAFGFGSLPFKFSGRNTTNKVSKFLNDNQENKLLSNNKFNIYLQFQDSKRNDLIKEYGDLTRRLLNLTGVIDFSNNIVNLPYNELFATLFNNFDIKITGESNFQEYEQNEDSIFFKNNSFIDYLGLDLIDVNASLNALSQKLNLSDLSKLPIYYKNVQEDKFNRLIDSKFDRKNTAHILSLIESRSDDDISNLVTDSANIPTIFEYILGIAWYHMSGKNYNLLDSLNLSLDASLLPLSHASGNKADIEIRDTVPSIVLEATLMDKNNQRRNELEPVIRHTVNFAVEQMPRDTHTIFVANEIDENVANIFRACAHIEMKHSSGSETVEGVNIFAFTIKEIINMLNNNVTTNEIIEIIQKNQSSEAKVKMGWREEITKQIFNL